MKNKILKFIVLGLGMYFFTLLLVVNFYNDDPENMDWHTRETFNQRFIDKLAMGEELFAQNVLKKLGTPDITEAKKVEEVVYQIMYYRTHHMKSDGITTRDECTALLFKNDLLIAWGDKAYRIYQAS